MNLFRRKSVTALQAEALTDQSLKRALGALKPSLVELLSTIEAELGAYIDAATAVSARSTDAKHAAEFVRFITGPQAKAIWSAKGLNRF